MDDVASEALRIVVTVGLIVLAVVILGGAVYIFRKPGLWTMVRLRAAHPDLQSLSAQLTALSEEVTQIRALIECGARRDASQKGDGEVTELDIGTLADGPFIYELTSLIGRHFGVEPPAVGPPAKPASTGAGVSASVPGDQPATGASILAWWCRNGHKGREAARRSIFEEFGSVNVREISGSPSAGNDWFILAIEIENGGYALIPRRKEGWNSEIFSAYFELKEKGEVKEGERINKLFAVTSAELQGQGWKVNGAKGVVSVAK